MMDKVDCKVITTTEEGGFGLRVLLQYMAFFYKQVMNGQARPDTPETLIKHSRDWEYPWVILKSEVKPGDKTLDCGSGYSPVPFVFSTLGAKAFAIDRDLMICSNFSYVLYCIKEMLLSIWRFFSELLNSSPRGAFTSEGLVVLIKKYGGQNYVRVKRLFKPDFWGPMSPRLLKKYGVTYDKGDITNMPYENESFDVVSSVSVFEHMPEVDQKKALDEMMRVLKPSGKLLLTFDEEAEGGGMALVDAVVKIAQKEPDEIICFKKPEIVKKNMYNRSLTDVYCVCLTK